MSQSPLRLDGFLSTTVFNPLRRALGEEGLRLPILMYHRICDDPEEGTRSYYKVNTSPAVFRQHVQQLAEMGCHTMTLVEAAALLANNQPLLPNRVIITFDDGFRDFYTHAFPLLREHGFVATMFLPTAFIGDQRQRFKETDCLTWDEVRLMHRAGIEFGSHTVHHPELVKIPMAEVEQELRDSKNRIEQELGAKATTFAYPYAFPQSNPEFVRGLRDFLIQFGYTCCVTTEIGRVKQGDDPFRLKRLPANSMDDSGLFRAKMEGGYDWLSIPQAFLKAVKYRNSGKQKPVAVPSAETLPIGRRS